MSRGVVRGPAAGRSERCADGRAARWAGGTEGGLTGESGEGSENVEMFLRKKSGELVSKVGRPLVQLSYQVGVCYTTSGIPGIVRLDCTVGDFERQS